MATTTQKQSDSVYKVGQTVWLRAVCRDYNCPPARPPVWGAHLVCVSGVVVGVRRRQGNLTYAVRVPCHPAAHYARWPGYDPVSGDFTTDFTADRLYATQGDALANVRAVWWSVAGRLAGIAADACQAMRRGGAGYGAALAFAGRRAAAVNKSRSGLPGLVVGCPYDWPTADTLPARVPDHGCGRQGLKVCRATRQRGWDWAPFGCQAPIDCQAGWLLVAAWVRVRLGPAPDPALLAMLDAPVWQDPDAAMPMLADQLGQSGNPAAARCARLLTRQWRV